MRDARRRSRGLVAFYASEQSSPFVDPRSALDRMISAPFGSGTGRRDRRNNYKRARVARRCRSRVVAAPLAAAPVCLSRYPGSRWQPSAGAARRHEVSRSRKAAGRARTSARRSRVNKLAMACALVWPCRFGRARHQGGDWSGMAKRAPNVVSRGRDKLRGSFQAVERDRESHSSCRPRHRPRVMSRTPRSTGTASTAIMYSH